MIGGRMLDRDLSYLLAFTEYINPKNDGGDDEHDDPCALCNWWMSAPWFDIGIHMTFRFRSYLFACVCSGV